MAYFAQHPESGVTRPEQIAVVGDRLSTDVMMANLMGSYGVWVRDGVQGRGFVSFLFFVSSVLPEACMLSVNLEEIADVVCDLEKGLTDIIVCEDGGSAPRILDWKGV